MKTAQVEEVGGGKLISYDSYQFFLFRPAIT